MPKFSDGMYQSSCLSGSSHFPAKVPLISWYRSRSVDPHA